MVVFYIGNNLDEIDTEICIGNLSLPEKLHMFLRDEFKYDYELMRLTDLSFYCDDTVIDKDTILLYKELSKRFKCYEGKNKEMVRNFFENLDEICNKALQNNKLIIAIGD